MADEWGVNPQQPTGTKLLSPPKLGPGLYWQRGRSGGFALDYKKRNSSQQTYRPYGFDYLYCGFWSRKKLAALHEQHNGNEEAIANAIRKEIQANAEKYLKRRDAARTSGT